MSNNQRFSQRYRSVLCILAALLTFSVVGCHGNISPETLRVCARGEKVENGGCKNPDSCVSESQCLEGFACKSNKCTPKVDCDSVHRGSATDREVCGAGHCSEVFDGTTPKWVCLNPERCEPDKKDQCVPGDYCTKTNVCATPSKQCDDSCAKDGRGLCTQNGCANPKVCALDKDCLNGFICSEKNHQCVKDDDTACTQPSPGGVCNRKKGEWEEVEHCKENKECFSSNYCKKAPGSQTGSCEKSQCSGVSDCLLKGGGVCLDGTCQDSKNCTKNDECLNGHFCSKRKDANNNEVGVCVTQENLCEPHCEGAQKCVVDQQNPDSLRYQCQSADPCQTSFDCVGDNVCVTGKCQAPSNASCTATEYKDKEYSNSSITGTLCDVSQKDVYKYTLNSAGIHYFKTVVTVTGKYVGRANLHVDWLLGPKTSLSPIKTSSNLDSYSGNNRSEYTVVTLGEFNTAKNADLFVTVTATDLNGKLMQGVEYSIEMEEVSEDIYKVCKNAQDLTKDLADHNGSSTQKFSLDDKGKVFSFVVSKESYYKVSAKPIDTLGNKAVSMKLTSDCNSSLASSFIKKETAASNTSPVMTSGTLTPGTYYVKLDAGTNPSTVQFAIDLHPVECKKGFRKCLSGGTALEYCDDEYRDIKRACECSGTSDTDGVCKEDAGKGCINAIPVDSNNINDFANKSYEIKSGSWDNSWSTIADPLNTCNATSDVLSSKDLTFLVTIPKEQILVASFTPTSEGQDNSIFIIDADKVFPAQCETNSCLQMVNQAGADLVSEKFEYANPDMKDKQVYVVVKMNAQTAYTDNLDVSFSFKSAQCVASQYFCQQGRTLILCNKQGNGYDSSEACPPNGGCIDADSSTNPPTPAHCVTAEGDTCSAAIELLADAQTTQKSSLDNQILAYHKIENNYNEFFNTNNCGDKYGANVHNYFDKDGEAVKFDNVYWVKNLKEGDLLKVEVTPKNDLMDPIIWIANDICGNTGSSNGCLKAANAYRESLDALGHPETLEYRVPKDGDYQVFVSNYTYQYAYPLEISKRSLYKISADVQLKNSATECDPATNVPKCTSNALTYCTELGFQATLTCQNGCVDGESVCKDPSRPELKGLSCEYAELIDTTLDSGTVTANLPKGTDGDYFYGQRVHFSEAIPGGIQGFVGYCFRRSLYETDSGAIRRIFAFPLKKGDTLTVTQKSYKSHDWYGSDFFYYILEDCYHLNSCQVMSPSLSGGYSTANTDTFDVKYHADKAKTVYLVASGTSKEFVFDWKISHKEMPCSAKERYCSDNDKVSVCSKDGSAAKEFTCPTVPTGIGCNLDACDLRGTEVDPKDQTKRVSKVFKDNTCDKPLDIGKGGSFLLDPSEIQYDEKDLPSTLCFSPTQKYKKTYYSLEVTPGDTIVAYVDQVVRASSYDHNYGVFIAPEGDCSKCIGDSAFDFDETGYSSSPLGKARLNYKYTGTSPGKVTVVVLSDNDGSVTPAYLDIYTTPKDLSCSTPNAFKCDGGEIFLCSQSSKQWEKKMVCSNGCADDVACNPDTSSRSIGNLPYAAAPLTVSTSGPQTVAVDDLESMDNNTDLLEDNGGSYGGSFKGACYFANSSYSGVKYAAGKDKYYQISLNKGDILKAELTSSKYKSVSLYLLDTDRRSCLVQDPTLTVASTGNTTRKLVFRAAKTGNYTLVVDTMSGDIEDDAGLPWMIPGTIPAGDIKLSYEVTQDESSLQATDFLHDCADATHLTSWSPEVDRYNVKKGTSLTWKENTVECADGCYAGLCTSSTNADSPDNVDNKNLVLNPPFVVSFENNSKANPLTSALDIDKSRFVDPPVSVRPKMPDAFYKVHLPQDHYLRVYSLTKGAYSVFYSVFKDKSGSDAVAYQLNIGTYSYLASPEELSKAYLATQDEDVYLGFDSFNSVYGYKKQMFFVDVVPKPKPACDPKSYQNRCVDDGTTQHHMLLQYCNAEGQYEQFQCLKPSTHDYEACSSSSPAVCPNPSGAMCFDAIDVDLTSATSYNDSRDLLPLGNYFSLTSSQSLTAGQDAVYKVSIPTGRSIDVEVNSDDGNTLSYLTENCGDKEVLAGTSAQQSFPSNSLLAVLGKPAKIDYSNTSGATKVVYLVVDSDSSMGTSSLSGKGEYTVKITLK